MQWRNSSHMDAVFKRSPANHSPDIEAKFKNIIVEQQGKKGLKKNRRRKGSGALRTFENMSSRFSSTHTALQVPAEPPSGRLPVIVKGKNVLVTDKEEPKAQASPEDIRKILTKSKLDKRASNNRSP